MGKDKKINILDIATEKVIRSFKQGGDFGDPIKVSFFYMLNMVIKYKILTNSVNRFVLTQVAAM